MTKTIDELVTENISLVHFVARKYQARALRHGIEYDDLYSAGLSGLFFAAKRFDTTRGKFATIAIPRIRGAIFDEIRSQDMYSRVNRQRRGKMYIAMERLRQQFQREPIDAEVAAALDISEEKLREWVLNITINTTVPIDGKYIVADIPSVDAGALKTSRQEWLTKELMTLPALNREVLVRTFIKDQPHEQIERELGYTDSYIRMLRRNGLNMLRKRMQPGDELLAA